MKGKKITQILKLNKIKKLFKTKKKKELVGFDGVLHILKTKRSFAMVFLFIVTFSFLAIRYPGFIDTKASTVLFTQNSWSGGQSANRMNPPSGNTYSSKSNTVVDGSGWVELDKDSVDTDTTLLLNGEGASFSDSSSFSNGPIIAFGDAQVSTLDKKFGNSSIKLDGNGDYITIPDSDGWDLDDDDFTIDLWASFNSLDTDPNFGDTFFSQATDNGNMMGFGYKNGKVLFYVLSGGSFMAYYEATWTADINNWHHFALVRKGNDIYIYIDGTKKDLVATNAIGNSVIPNFTGALNVGKQDHPSWPQYIDGYIDEFRITKGVALWDPDFTPSSSYYSCDANTDLLLHGDGLDGSRIFADSSLAPKNYNYYGDSQISTTSSKFGGSSIKLDGTGDYIAYSPNSNDWNFGTDDFTVDFWANWSQIKDGGIFGFNPNVLNAVNLNAFGYNASQYDALGILIRNGGVDQGFYLKNFVPVIGNWYHIALERDGVNLYLYINGEIQTWDTINVAINESTTIGFDGTPFVIGRQNWDSFPHGFAGYIDEFRISKDVLRWNPNLVSVPSSSYSVQPYLSSGELVSSEIDIGHGTSWGSIDWGASIPAGASIGIQSRSSVDGSSWSCSWSGPGACSESLLSGDTGNLDISSLLSGRYFQYKINLVTNDPSTTPVFKGITLNVNNNPPNNPVIVSPNNGAINQSITPTLNFTQSDPDVSDNERYNIQVSTDAGFSSIILDYQSEYIPQGPTSFIVGQPNGGGNYTIGSYGQKLDYSKNYYWRVKSQEEKPSDSGLSTAWVSSSFTTAPPPSVYTMPTEDISKTEKVNWIQTDWSGGASAGTLNNQAIGWNKYDSQVGLKYLNGSGLKMEKEIIEKGYGILGSYVESAGALGSFSESNGDTISVWAVQKSTGKFDVSVKKIDLNNNQKWLKTLTISPDYITSIKVISDNMGGIFLSWRNQKIIQIQKIDYLGNVKWSATSGYEGVLVTNVSSGNNYYNISSDQNGGAMLSWSYYDGTSHKYYAILQYYSVSGGAVMTNELAGGKIVTESASNVFSSLFYETKTGLFVTYNIKNTLYLKKYYTNGNQVLNYTWASYPSGIPLSSTYDFSGNNMIISIDSSSNIFVVWRESSNNIYSIKAQKVNTNGSFSWASYGINLSGSTDKAIGINDLVPDKNGGAIINWNIFGVDGGYYLQRIDTLGVKKYNKTAYGISIPALSSTAVVSNADVFIVSSNIVDRIDGLGNYYSAWGGSSGISFGNVTAYSPKISYNSQIDGVSLVYTTNTLVSGAWNVEAKYIKLGVASGSLLSSVFDSKISSRKWGVVSWKAFFNGGGNISLRVRSSENINGADSIYNKSWSLPIILNSANTLNGVGSSILSSINGRYIQYSLGYTLTIPFVSPVLSELNIGGSYTVSESSNGIIPPTITTSNNLIKTTTNSASVELNQSVANSYSGKSLSLNTGSTGYFNIQNISNAANPKLIQSYNISIAGVEKPVFGQPVKITFNFSLPSGMDYTKLAVFHDAAHNSFQPDTFKKFDINNSTITYNATTNMVSFSFYTLSLSDFIIVSEDDSYSDSPENINNEKGIEGNNDDNVTKIPESCSGSLEDIQNSDLIDFPEDWGSDYPLSRYLWAREHQKNIYELYTTYLKRQPCVDEVNFFFGVSPDINLLRYDIITSTEFKKLWKIE